MTRTDFMTMWAHSLGHVDFIEKLWLYILDLETKDL